MAESEREEFDSSRRFSAINGDREELLPLLRDIREHLSSGGSGGTYADMERVARLEARADSTDQRLGRIEDKLDRLLERTGSMPTTNGLWGMIATVIGVALTMIGLVVGVLALFL